MNIQTVNPYRIRQGHEFCNLQANIFEKATKAKLVLPLAKNSIDKEQKEEYLEAIFINLCESGWF